MDWHQASVAKVFTLPHSKVGIHKYKVRACNGTVCSAYTAPQMQVDVLCGGSASACNPQRAAQSTIYIHTDQLDSPIAETDATGLVTARFRYEPFGLSLEASPVAGPSYTGHVLDPNSGLIYMEARYYDPVIGRFLSTDPVPVNGLGLNFNRYNYANNNPYAYVDPDGRTFVLAVPAPNRFSQGFTVFA